uniref:Ammonium transporter n=1 Tax=Rhodnius neglectus TaxID=72488 RepID=A0A0N7Z8Z4_9HEMI
MEDLKKDMDDFFLLTNAIFVSFMQAGFACLESGAVRTKNSLNIIMKNLLDLLICAVFYYITGYTLAYEDGNSFLGYSRWAGYGFEESKLAYWFFQFIFAATAATIISGAVAERCNFVAYIVYSGLISGVVYPIVSHWAWHQDGWLRNMGYSDFAGCGVVHALAGVCSFVAAALLGPRIGRFSNGKPKEIPGHSLPLVGVGALLLISGFLAFNGGSLGHITQPGDSETVARSMFSTIVGGSGGATVSLILGRVGMYGPSPWPFSPTLNAALAGMVSVCGAPEAYATWAAFLCGAIGCLIYFALHRLVLFLKVDDPLDTVAVHFGAGVWGVFARALLSQEGLIYADPNALNLLLHNAIGVFAIICWSAVTSIILFGSLKLLGLLRISEEEELKGLDISKHGETSYPSSAWGWYNDTVEFYPENGGTFKMKREYDNHAFQLEKRNQEI